MFSYTKRDTYNSDGYSEIVNPSWFIDNRTEMIFSLPKLSVNMGLEEKFQSVNAYDDFFFEPVNVWDLSSKALRSDLNYALAASGNGGYAGVIVPGWPGRYATPGIINNDTNQSEAETASPFVQATWNVNEMFNVVSGARLDLTHVESHDPFTPNAASLGFGEPNANLSLVFKPSAIMSTYATVNYSQNYTGDLADGGGFGLYTDANGNATLPRSLFSEKSLLYEVGGKITPLNSKLFISADVFEQTRQYKPQASPVIQYQFYGFEISGNYQPNKNFFGTFGFSWINGSTPAPAPFQAYATQQIPGGPPDPFTSPQQETGYLRAPGQPLATINGLAQYTFDNGFGFEANVLVTSPMNADYAGNLVVPWQYSVDSAAFYKTKRYELRITVTNLTNQHNWTPSDATYAYEGIVSDAGIEVFGTVKLKF